MKDERDSNTISRRSFLTGAGVAAVAGAGLLAGCSSGAETPAASTGSAEAETATQSWRTAPAAIQSSEITETEDCDVLVIGLGYAGSAAVRAAGEAGAKVVAIDSQTQENFHRTGMGHFGHINSRFLASRGVPQVDEVEFMRNWQLHHGNLPNQALVMNFTRECGDAFDWYIEPLSDEEKASLQIQFYDGTNGGFAPEHDGIKTWIGSVSTMDVQDKALGAMVEKGTANGGKVIYGAKACQLVTSADGSVTGAIAKTADGYLQVNAKKGVIVAAGDFSINAEMCHDLLRNIDSLVGPDGLIAGLGQDGSGIQMCYWAGGRLDPYMASMGGDYYYPCDSPIDPIGSSAALWINADGKRFCNEGFGCLEWASRAGAVQPEGLMTTVFDSNVIEMCKAQNPGHMGFEWETMGFDALNATLQAAVANGDKGSLGTGNANAESADKGAIFQANVFAANDLKTLAGYLGYTGDAVENFVKSVERYNECCAAGKDEDFGKDEDLLFPVTTPPFYAYGTSKLLGGMLVTGSGVLIDENGQVLGQDFRPIKGLFAAGNTSGSRFGSQYTTPIPGVSISMAVTMGRHTGTYVAS